MSARDELRRYVHLLADMWTPTKVTDERVESLYATVRTEVLTEAGLLPKADVVAWLVKKAREGTPVEVLASKVERGAVRPDNLRMLPDAGFFEHDRTYQRDGNLPGDGPWVFKVAAQALDPHGHTVAFGFLSRDGVLWIDHAEGADSWAKDGWVDVTEDGAQ